MKKLIIALCFLATIANAEIGMSPQQCDSAYGKPTYIWERKDFTEGWQPDRQLVQPWQEVRVYFTAKYGEVDAYFIGEHGARTCRMIWTKSNDHSQGEYTLNLPP